MASSTGTLMAAALETAGYEGLSQVLGELGGMIGEIGALLYLVSAISGLVTTALLGKYRAGLWFLIGPAVFWWVIDPQVESSGADWQYGQELNSEDVAKVLGYSVKAKVPWIFDAYNQVISGVIQDFIGVVTNQNLATQIKFMSRQRIMDKLYRSKLENGGLIALVHRGIKGACHDEMNNARLIALGNRGDKWFRHSPEYRRALWKYAKNVASQNISIEENTPAYNYLHDLFNAVRAQQGEETYDLNCPNGPIPIKDEDDPSNKNNINIDFTADGFSPGEVLGRPVSCRQIWCWMGIGLAKEAGQLQKDAQGAYVAKYADGTLDYDNIYQEIWFEIANKLSPSTVDSDKLIEPDVSLIPVIIGGILLRKELMDDSRSKMYQEIATHAQVYTRDNSFKLQMTMGQQQDVLQRMHKHTMSTSQRYEVFILAQILPYVQGVLLYALAISFPFFAVLIVLPGKAMSFFSWFALWLWVKSWDLGFAVVYVIDGLLWELMPHSSVFNADKDPQHGPIDMFEMAFQFDPAYSLSHYYMIVGVLVTGVPIVTAQMILGSKQAIGGVIIDGLKNMSQKLAGAAADWTAHDQVMRTDYIREKFIAKYTLAHLNQDASKDITDLKAQADAADGTGKTWRGAAGGVAGVAAVAPFVPVAGKPLSAFAAYSANKMYGKGLDISRSANAARAQIVSVNADLHKFNATQTKEFLTMNAVRAGLSGRGEFWNMNEAPEQALASIKRIRTDIQRSVTGDSAEAIGGIIGNLAKLKN